MENKAFIAQLIKVPLKQINEKLDQFNNNKQNNDNETIILTISSKQKLSEGFFS